MSGLGLSGMRYAEVLADMRDGRVLTSEGVIGKMRKKAEGMAR